jgi:hypothetical protein
MADLAANPMAESPIQGRRVAFRAGHLWVLLICWFPLNPFVLHYFTQYFRSNFAVTIDDKLAYFELIVSTIFGPFTAMLEGRNKDFCLQVAWQLMPVCLGAVAFAIALQILWRPNSIFGRVFRMTIWGVAWFVWFAGAFVSVLSNAG